MRKYPITLAIAFLMLAAAPGCKKKESSFPSFAGIAGPHTWVGTDEQWVDSSGVRVAVTQPLVFNQAVVIVNGSTIEYVTDSGGPVLGDPLYVFTLKAISTDAATTTLTFAGVTDIKTLTIQFTSVDTMFYNYSNNSIIWHAYRSMGGSVYDQVAMHTP